MLMDASAWDYESQKPTYANFESHALIHQQGGAVFYTHPARWWTGAWGGQGGYPRQDRMRVSNMAVELPLDTILGPTFDGVDVITGPGEAEANEKAFALWAMLLNHGYRLAATGSSDACFDRTGGAGARCSADLYVCSGRILDGEGHPGDPGRAHFCEHRAFADCYVGRAAAWLDF
jgi:hypothetical protein